MASGRGAAGSTDADKRIWESPASSSISIWVRAPAAASRCPSRPLDSAAWVGAADLYVSPAGDDAFCRVVRVSVGRRQIDAIAQGDKRILLFDGEAVDPEQTAQRQDLGADDPAGRF